MTIKFYMVEAIISEILVIDNYLIPNYQISHGRGHHI